MNIANVLDREFLEIRSLIVQLAAGLDRIERCPFSTKKDPRLDLIVSSLRLIQESGSNRAEQVQLLFSRDFDPDWKKTIMK